MAEPRTAFDLILNSARELDITVITGRLWPPRAGSIWLDDQSLEEILLPHASSHGVALAVIPGGPGWEHVRQGKSGLDAEKLAQLARIVAEAGGTLYQGRLELLTPQRWLERHGQMQQFDNAQAMLEAARESGWPANFGDYPVLFLDEQAIYHLLARENVGRNVTLLVGTLLKSPREIEGQE